MSALDALRRIIDLSSAPGRPGYDVATFTPQLRDLADSLVDHPDAEVRSLAAALRGAIR